MLSINNINVSYGEKKVLKDFSLSLNEGRVHGLAGLNGSGKTTLLNTLFGLLKPVSGNITFNESKLTRDKISYLETQNYFYPGITGKEYLNLFQTQDLNDNFQLKNWENLLKIPTDELIENYSSGMKKKLALLAVIKINKKIVLLDEPFNNLDMESGYILKTVIKKLKEQKKIIILTSHIIETLNDTCDKIHHLHNGSIAHSYLPEDFSYLGSVLEKDIAEKTKDLIDKIYS